MRLVQSVTAGNLARVKGNIVRTFTRMKHQGPFFFGKWVFHPERIQTLFRGEIDQVRPVTAEFVPSLECTYRCPTCTYLDWKHLTAEQRGRRFMDLGLMKELIQKLKDGGLKALIFTGGGEPLTNKHTLDGMKFARELGLDVGLFTNGHLLNQERIARLLIDIVPNFIRVSLNAASPDVHQRVHNLRSTNPFFKVIENLSHLARIKYQHGSKTTIGLGMLVSRENMADLVGLAALLERVTQPYPGGIDYVAFRPTVMYGGAGKEQQAFDELQQAQRQLGGVILPAIDSLGIKMINIYQRFYDLHNPRGYRYCLSHPWRLSVAYDGGVYICAENNGRPEFYFGNLAERTLQEIWDGPRRQQVVEELNNGMMDRLCPPICVLTYMNKTFEELRLYMREADVEQLEKFLEVVRLAREPADVNFL